MSWGFFVWGVFVLIPFQADAGGFKPLYNGGILLPEMGPSYNRGEPVEKGFVTISAVFQGLVTFCNSLFLQNSGLIDENDCRNS